ncbi:MAG: SdrD B-like domain-containing protein [Candidatus Eisenbacteria bacterium]
MDTNPDIYPERRAQDGLDNNCNGFVDEGIAVYADDFNDDTIDSLFWTPRLVGDGPAIAEINHRLELTIPANSAETDDDYFWSGLDGVCQVRGDFDIQVDYQLLVWPTSSGVRVGLGVGGGGVIDRASLGANDIPWVAWRESYFTGFVGQDLVPETTCDLSGTMRLTRSGDTLTGYYLSLGSWVAISSAEVTTADMSMHISAWSHDPYFTDHEVQVSFDNFTVNQGQIVCPAAEVSGVVTTDCPAGTPLPDVLVTLSRHGQSIAETTTGEDGSYLLSATVATGYELDFEVPSSYVPIDPVAFDLSSSGWQYDVEFVCQRGACCLPDGICQMEVGAVCEGGSGVYRGDGTVCEPNPCLVEVSGLVSSDCDGPLEGVLVRLARGTAVVDSTVTLVDGSFSLPDVAFSAEPHELAVDVPDGYAAATPPDGRVAIDATQNQQVEFGLACQFVDVSGTIASDCVGPEEGVMVRLVAGDSDTLATVADSSGAFLFADVRYSDVPGLLSIQLPSGYQSVTPPNGQTELDLTQDQSVDFELLCPTGSVSGTVTADCPEDDHGLGGVLVDLFDGSGALVADVTTETDGSYLFDEVFVAQDYAVLVVTPLGYQSTPSAQVDVTLESLDAVADVHLHCVDIVEDARTIGFWKNNVSKALQGRTNGIQVTAEELVTYSGIILEHFYENFENPIDIEGVTYRDSSGVSIPLDLAAMDQALDIHQANMIDRARQQYLALLLNTASQRLATYSVVSEDDRTCSQAITYVAMLIKDGDSANDEIAKDVADTINNSMMVAAGLIPDVDDIPYREGGIPSVTQLLGVFPTPFGEATTIRYALATEGRVNIQVVDVGGRVVRELVDSQQAAGIFRVSWDGRTSAGAKLGAGVYFVRFVADRHEETRRTVLIR